MAVASAAEVANASATADATIPKAGGETEAVSATATASVTANASAEAAEAAASTVSAAATAAYVVQATEAVLAQTYAWAELIATARTEEAAAAAEVSDAYVPQAYADEVTEAAAAIEESAALIITPEVIAPPLPFYAPPTGGDIRITPNIHGEPFRKIGKEQPAGDVRGGYLSHFNPVKIDRAPDAERKTRSQIATSTRFVALGKPAIAGDGRATMTSGRRESWILSRRTRK